MKSFGYYKNNIDSILESCYGNKKLFKENFHVLMGALKLSKPFREFFTVYNEVEQRKFKNKEELTEYINESIYYLRPKIKSIKGVCNILERVFGKRKNIIKENNNNIYSHLDYLIYKKGVRNITKRLDIKNNLIESVINKKSSKNLGTKLKPEVLVKESKEENLKAKLTETKNVVLKMNSDKLSILRLKQLGKDLN